MASIQKQVDQEGLRRHHIQALIHELTQAETRERERLAHGLHDEVVQLLALTRIQLSLLREQLGQPSDPQTGTLLHSIDTGLRQAVEATRLATFDLCHPVLKQRGLREAIVHVAQQMSRASGLLVRVEGDWAEGAFGEASASVLFRVIRELLFNARKHAQARQVVVSLVAKPHHWEISVRDDGRGFDVASAPRRFDASGGFGLVSAQAQMRALGGDLTIQSHAQAGTCALVRLPRQEVLVTHSKEASHVDPCCAG